MGRTGRVGSVAALVAATLIGGACTSDYVRWLPDDDRDRLDRAVPYLKKQFLEVDQAETKTAAPAEGEDAAGSDLWRKFRLLVERGRVAPTFDALKIKGVTSLERADWSETSRDNEAKLALSYRTEREALAKTSRDPRIGVALSGGGVRSASFAQGVLKGLHETGLLASVGYLSTVSGGGYAGGWYMLHRRDDGELLGDGSVDLRHLSKSGKILDTGGFDSALMVYLNGAVEWGLTLPYHLVANVLLDLDVRATGFRWLYRLGIRDAFLYHVADDPEQRSNPLSKRTLGWCTPQVTDALWELTKSARETRPVWIVNCHLALGNDYRFRNRTGDAFEITPFRAGADAVGYVEVSKPPPAGSAAHEDFRSFGKPGTSDSDFWMRADYAVAASGAALDGANTRKQDLFDTLRQGLNLNLGYVIDGWSRYWIAGDSGGWYHRAWVKTLACVPFVGWFVPQDGRESDSPKYYITDGGHFENTGVYALVRRGCRLILCSDAGFDPMLSRCDDPDPFDPKLTDERARAFEDVRTLEERLQADFGAKLDIAWDAYSPHGGGPRTSYDCLGADAPPEDARGDGRVLVATIDNVPVDEGFARVVVLFVRMHQPKLTALRDVYGTIDREKALDPEFGNDPTTNQFFSEDRVLAYRELGVEIVEQNVKLIDWAVARLGKPPE